LEDIGTFRARWRSADAAGSSWMMSAETGVGTSGSLLASRLMREL
jgi:hypothetical protein